MTRATLLHVLDRPTALGPAEVRELEQLAQAFPYCQTAHLLLAKAAHDQGTMLAGQRLRRAATYAADRTLLRRLIEQAGPAPAEIAPLTVAEPAAPDVPALAEPEDAVQVAAPGEAVPATAVLAPPPVVVAEPVTPPGPPEPELASSAPDSPSLPSEPYLMPAAEVPAELAQVTESQPPVVENSPEAVPALPVAEALPPVAEAVEPVKAEEAPQTAPLAAELVDREGIHIPAAAPQLPLLLEPEPAPESTPPVEQAVEADLPAQAPAIRPPAEVGEARFEFGLAPEPTPAAPAYELPGLVDEWAAAAVTLSMGSPEPLTNALAPTAENAEQRLELTPAAFTGDATLGYGFGESSRLGFSLQLLNLLDTQAEATEAATAWVAAAQPPAAALPPVGAFFEPDPLLLDYWATHCPPPPALPSSLDLINNFLKRQPRLTRPAMLPPSPTVQADLSVRSTRAEPDLASESLARILVRQGKTARAIEIYEKLMVKQPEKMAYFAAQIQLLQPPA